MVFCNTVKSRLNILTEISHNPYFSRWFSAIAIETPLGLVHKVTILILVDGFLQYHQVRANQLVINVTILILVDGFLQSLNYQIQILNIIASQSLF